MQKTKIIIWLLVIFLIISSVAYFYWCNTRIAKYNHNIEEYRTYNEKIFKMSYFSELLIFPNELDETKMVVSEYTRIDVKQALRRVGGLIFLDITYNDETMYNSEIDRLQTYVKEFQANSEPKVLGFYKDETCKFFNYPSYVSAYNASMVYEYALLMEKNEIVYVHLYNMEPSEVKFIDQFLPKEYVFNWNNVHYDKIYDLYWSANYNNLYIE